MDGFTRHWAELGLGFDGIYSGYLGRDAQIAKEEDFIARFGGSGTLTLVDPAMADGGKMNPSFSDGFAAHMAKLCGKADVIVPNITEAAFMLGLEYKAGPY